MRALRLDGGRLGLSDVPPPQPPPGEALIRVRLAGICHTDQELARGYMSFAGTPGHEFVGEIVALGDGAEAAGPPVGERVVGEINAACGTCHVYVEPTDASALAALPEIDEYEEETLAELASRRENSRLSCQLVGGPAVADLTLTVAPR